MTNITCIHCVAELHIELLIMISKSLILEALVTLTGWAVSKITEVWSCGNNIFNYVAGILSVRHPTMHFQGPCTVIASTFGSGCNKYWLWSHGLFFSL
jgi:hypothetical protein